MEMYDVLSKLQQIENPTEDQKQAIENTQAMTQAPEAVATDPVPAPEVPEAALMGINNTLDTNATGSDLFQKYEQVAQETTADDMAKLAGIDNN
jgi:hypothetical protein